jgi:hypothetical protein
MEEIEEILKGKAVVRLWPEAGKVLDLTRGQTYRGAQKGDIPTITIGKLKRVSTRWLRTKTGIEPTASA